MTPCQRLRRTDRVPSRKPRFCWRRQGFALAGCRVRRERVCSTAAGATETAAGTVRGLCRTRVAGPASQPSEHVKTGINVVQGRNPYPTTYRPPPTLSGPYRVLCRADRNEGFGAQRKNVREDTHQEPPAGGGRSPVSVSENFFRFTRIWPFLGFFWG